MQAKNEGVPASLQFVMNRRKKIVRRVLKPKSAKRKEYECRWPCLSQRISQDDLFRFHNDRNALKLSGKQYLHQLIQGASLYLEEVRKISYDEGFRLGEEKGFRRGQALRAELERAGIENETKKESTLFFRCRNHGFSCNGLIPIEPGSKEHVLCAELLERYGYLCPSCQMQQIISQKEAKPQRYRSSIFPWLE